MDMVHGREPPLLATFGGGGETLAGVQCVGTDLAFARFLLA